jgi:hypothetical protein
MAAVDYVWAVWLGWTRQSNRSIGTSVGTEDGVDSR